MDVRENGLNIYRGPKPTCREDIETLITKYGISTILNLQNDLLEIDDIELEQLRVTNINRRLGTDVAFYHESMSLLWPASRKSLIRAVKIIRAAVLSRETIYVHCSDGVSRCGIVLWAYDVWFRGMSVYDGLQEMFKDGFRLWRYFWWIPFIANHIQEEDPCESTWSK